MNTKAEKKQKRIKRIRNKITGTKDRPRLTVFRSNRYVYAQIIDDNKGFTLASASSIKAKEKSSKAKLAKTIGEELAKKAKTKKVTTVVFDRRGYKYHGIVKALAEGAREGGLKF